MRSPFQPRSPFHLSWTRLLGDSGDATPEPEAYPTTAASLVNVTPLTYDEWVYDSGAARGLNSAALPVSGTAADNGASIYARAVRADTQEAVTTWQEIGTVAGGSWSGFVACPRSYAFPADRSRAIERGERL